jgi:hypothetical protein
VSWLQLTLSQSTPLVRGTYTNAYNYALLNGTGFAAGQAVAVS